MISMISTQTQNDDINALCNHAHNTCTSLVTSFDHNLVGPTWPDIACMCSVYIDACMFVGLHSITCFAFYGWTPDDPFPENHIGLCKGFTMTLYANKYDTVDMKSCWTFGNQIALLMNMFNMFAQVAFHRPCWAVLSPTERQQSNIIVDSCPVPSIASTKLDTETASFGPIFTFPLALS